MSEGEQQSIVIFSTYGAKNPKNKRNDRNL